jgi:replicative DNA helicase
MPQAPEAEAAVLGSMTMDQRAGEVALSLLKPDAFFVPRHRTIFEALGELHRQGQVLDLTTLGAELRRQSRLEECGGLSGLAALAEAVMTPENITHYCQLVLEKYRARQLIQRCHELTQLAMEQSLETTALLDTAEQSIFELGQERITRDYQSIGNLAREVLEDVERRSLVPDGITGVATGFEELDAMTGGFQPSDLIILAARPSVGKTAIALNFACNVGLGWREVRFIPEKRIPVAIFSLEMSSSQVAKRMISTISRVSMHAMNKGQLEPDQQQALVKAAHAVQSAPIFIDDTAGLTILELRAKTRRLKSEHPNLGLVVVDYMQLMRGSGRYDNRQQEISEISRGLKILARELHVPILALSQLSRNIETRKKDGSALPMLSDLRESGSIEQDADMVMFVHRQKFDEDERPVMQEAKIIIGKQRNGPIGDVDLLFEGATATYHNIDRKELHRARTTASRSLNDVPAF